MNRVYGLETSTNVYIHPFRGHLDCVKVLLQLNAPLRPRTPEEDTPKELAVRYKQKEVVEILGKEERGEGVNGESRGKGLAERMEGRGGGGGTAGSVICTYSVVGMGLMCT